MKILIVDNYDSFTYNLSHLLESLKLSVTVRRNDRIGLGELQAMAPDIVVVSPGPGRPSESGNTNAIIAACCPRIPILGVCLGMQAINEVFGGRTTHAPQPVHGKSRPIYHKGQSIFQGLPSPFRAARYHSLICAGIPPCLSVIAVTEDGLPMAFIHNSFPICGVQFHPESFLTEYGSEIVRNYLLLAAGRSLS